MAVLRALASTNHATNHARSAVSSKSERGPRLRVTIREASFDKSGRHYLTLTAGGQDSRTDVSVDSTKSPKFNTLEHEFGVGADTLALLDLRVAAHRLMFSKGAKEIGMLSLSLGGAVINGATQECEAQLVDPRSKVVAGTVRLSWCVDDRDAAEQAAAEREAAERAEAARAIMAQQAATAAAAEHAAMERAASLLASAQQAAEKHAAREREAVRAEEEAAAAVEATWRAQEMHVHALKQRRTDEARAADAATSMEAYMNAAEIARARTAQIESERAAESRAIDAQREEEANRVDAELREMLQAEERAADAAAAARAVEDEAARVAERERERKAERVRAAAAALASAAEAAAAEATRAANAARAQQQWDAARLQWGSKWEHVLASRVVLLRDDGTRFELSGRQVVGLCDALATSGKRALAFSHRGMRVTMTSEMAIALRAALNGRMHERTIEGDLFFEMPADVRATTAPMAPPDAPAAQELRHTVSAPPRAEAILFEQALVSQRVARVGATHGRRSVRIAPAIPEDV